MKIAAVTERFADCSSDPFRERYFAVPRADVWGSLGKDTDQLVHLGLGEAIILHAGSGPVRGNRGGILERLCHRYLCRSVKVLVWLREKLNQYQILGVCIMKRFVINRVDLGQRITGHEVFDPAVNGGINDWPGETVSDGE